MIMATNGTVKLTFVEPDSARLPVALFMHQARVTSYQTIEARALSSR